MDVTIEQIEEQKAMAKKLVDRRNMALKLSTNREFRKLILEDFCETEAARSIRVSTEPGLTREDREDAIHAAQAAGHLMRWLRAITQLGNVAEREIAEADSVLEEMRAEEGLN